MGNTQPDLTPGERILYETRPHWRAILTPILLALAFLLAWSLLGSWINWSWFNTASNLVLLVGLVVFVAVPIARWASQSYTLTDRRFITRKGILAKQGRDVSLGKINNTTFVQTGLGRLLNYGSLKIDSAASDGQLVVRSVPDVQRLQTMINEQINLPVEV